MENSQKKIILIVGPSGVGKDSILEASKEYLSSSLHLVKRYITRKPNEHEDNHYLSVDEFKVKVQENFFASHWGAHENLYGIAKASILDGVNIISISRGSIKDFEALYDKVYTLHITVPKEVLRQRLLNRGRESLEQIEKRLERSYESLEAKHLIEFDNQAPLEEGAIKFAQLLKGIEDDKL